MIQTEIVEHFGNVFEYFSNDCMAISCLGSQKKWEPHILSFVEKYNELVGIENIVDIGSNFGYHSVFFSKIIGKKGVVFSFEPQIQNYELLCRNIQHNHIQNIFTFPYACSDIDEDVYFPVIERSDVQINMGDFTPNYFDSDIFTNSEKREVKAVSIDSMKFPNVRLMKIDVQGWELKVLQGSKQLIEKYKPVLIVEFEHHQLVKTNTTCNELAEYIRSLGYYLFYLEYVYPSDHICVHHSQLDAFHAAFGSFIFDHKEDNSVNNHLHFGINKKIVV